MKKSSDEDFVVLVVDPSNLTHLHVNVRSWSEYSAGRTRRSHIMVRGHSLALNYYCFNAEQGSALNATVTASRGPFPPTTRVLANTGRRQLGASGFRTACSVTAHGGDFPRDRFDLYADIVWHRNPSSPVIEGSWHDNIGDGFGCFLFHHSGWSGGINTGGCGFNHFLLHHSGLSGGIDTGGGGFIHFLLLDSCLSGGVDRAGAGIDFNIIVKSQFLC